jgi:hypothetical protein
MGKQSVKRHLQAPRPMGTAEQLLDSMHERPGLWWGGGDYPFTSLIAFVSGFRLGYSEAQRPLGFCSEDLVPQEFPKFVAEKLGNASPVAGMGWLTLITEHTSSEREAFDLFFQLRKEYDRVKIQTGAPKTKPRQRR